MTAVIIIIINPAVCRSRSTCSLETGLLPVCRSQSTDSRILFAAQCVSFNVPYNNNITILIIISTLLNHFTIAIISSFTAPNQNSAADRYCGCCSNDCVGLPRMLVGLLVHQYFSCPPPLQSFYRQQTNNKQK